MLVLARRSPDSGCRWVPERYCQRSPEQADDSFAVDRIFKKPEQKHVQEYLSSGDYLWNSDMFMFGTSEDSIDNGNRYPVKRITVKPDAKLSVQMHHHRVGHWIAVSGTAWVTNGEKTYLVTKNQSTYIPIGQIHSLENPGASTLNSLKSSQAPILGEDDIVRL